MKKLLLISVALISIIFYSCKEKDSPEGIEYAGTWSGVYTGDGDSGSWTVTIDNAGDVTGSAISSTYPATYNLVGTIDPQGDFIATAGSASTGTQFIGQFTSTTASGTWSNTAIEISGTWSGEKE